MPRSLISLFILSMLLCISCHQQETKGKYTIAFSQCIGTDAWRQTMLQEMKRELSFHPEVTFLYADAQGNSQQQIKQIASFLKQDIDLLIVSPNEADPLTPIVNSTYQQNIPVIVTDRKTSSHLYNAYVGADNVAIGNLAGKYIGNMLNGKGNIALITGLKGTSASMEREKGLRESLRDYPLIQIGTVLEGQWERAKARNTAQAHIDELESSDLIFAFNDQMALGVRESLLQQNKAVNKIIIGVDALPGPANGLEQITKGHLQASMLYPTGGAEAIRTAMAILQKKSYQRDNLLGTLVIDSSNANLMALQSKKIELQQADIDRQQVLMSEQSKIYNDQKAILNVLIVSLVMAVVFGGISIIVIKSNWNKNKHLEIQNREILQQQQQLIEMSEQVKEASEARSNFFTNVSHEFKTPLTLILAPVDELLKEKGISNDSKEQLQRIRRSAHKLLQLVNELIDIHKISKSKITLQAAPVQVDHFMHQVITTFKPLSTRHRISLSYSNRAQVKELWFDEYLLEQVMSNLLSNAFKFTEKNGKIEVILERNTFGDHVYLRVIDNGRGISAEHLDHVFDPFYQGGYSPEGSGIGLSYVQEIINLHHGQITVSSKLGEGSCFTVRLPIGHVHLKDTERRQSVIPVVPISNPALLSNDYSPKIVEDEISFTSIKLPSILLIDDHADIRIFLKELLKQEYNIYTADSYDRAVQIATSKLPDLIVCDVMLPDKSGIDVLKRLKFDAQTSHIPIILLTAIDSDEGKIAGLKAMADAYLTKPFNADHLKAVIENLLYLRRELKERYISEIEPMDELTDRSYSDQDKRFLNSLSAVVETRLSDAKLSVEDISTELNMSRVQLYRKVKALLQCSVNEYLLQRRLKKAKHLIIEGLNINEIAEKVGFSSSAYFTSAFKKHCGMTPSTFKKEKIK
ncbi:substrate-binding domain-containing protein [Sphingobacterium sp. SYP-B4668]|uniref:substrate-binding domain-containing protein n=1 Tax=Sphingobacterium sp. SYP-B4668 TaxID=2996035 RepID=UPI0005324A80|nr:substrate-binding domain-containing protein [Sphingobacterium sp. SYP-B4668]